MLEGDDNHRLKEKLDRARKDPSVSPNLKYALERQVKQNEKHDLAKLNKDVARKQQKEQRDKFKKDVEKKGVLTSAQEGEGQQQLIDKAKRQEAAQRAQGQTENPTQAV